MATAKINHLPDLVPYVIRPALVEARLINEKHASDAVYMGMLTEELRGVESKITILEEALLIRLSGGAFQPTSCGDPTECPDANWIRTEPYELCLRLRRIEESSSQRCVLRTGPGSQHSKL